MEKLFSHVTTINLTVAVVSTAVALIVAWYIKFTRSTNYWSSIGVTGPAPKFPSGNFHEFINSSYRNVTLKWCSQFGRVFGVYDGTKPVLITTEPELIKEILIKNGHIFTDRRQFIETSADKHTRLNIINKQGDDWKADRRIMSPTFTSGKMKAMFNLMVECYKKLDDELDRLVRRGKEVDAKILFSKLTSTVIARCAFATVIDPYTDENDPLLKSLHGLFQVNKFKMIILRFLPVWLKNLLRLTVNPPAYEYVKRVCKEIVRKRIESGTSGQRDYNDLIQLLIDAGRQVTPSNPPSEPDHESHHGMEDDPDAVKAINSTLNNHSSGKKTLTEDEIIANVIIFFVAGFETTSSFLSFASFVLTTEPDVQEKLYRELKVTFDEKSGFFDYETLSSHAYLDSFISETLRLYSPANQVQRLARKNCKLNNGISLKLGHSVIVPVHALHLDPEYFEEPDKFHLERFLPQNRSKVIPYTYLPFGTGPRNCIGMRFALLEAKMTLANLMMKYKFVSSVNTTRQLKFQPMAIVTSNDGPIIVKVERREA